MAASQQSSGVRREKKRKLEPQTEPEAIVDVPENCSPDLGTPIQPGIETSHESQLLSLHRARFVDWNPTAVTAVAASNDSSMLAVARDSGVVELWETEYWTCLTTLMGSREMAITSLAWLQEETTGGWRLVSGGLDGFLTEWDISRRKAKHRTDALGGAVWAIAAQPANDGGASERIAVACDDGCLRLFRIDNHESGLLYESSMPALSHRLLSVAWHPHAKVAVTGTSDGSLHAWEIATKRELLRIHTGDERKEHHDVWAVAVLADGTMVSGDGAGNLQFWSAAHGSLIGSFRLHIAAILAIAADPSGKHVFAAGIDHQIASFQKLELNTGRPSQWQYLSSKRPHTHDVRTMAVITQPSQAPLLITGGNDTHLFAHHMSNFAQKPASRLTSAPEAAFIQLACAATQSPLLLSMHQENVDLWRLGSTSAHTVPQDASKRIKEGEAMSIRRMPEHLGRLTTAEGGILSAAISDDGSLVALADCRETHLYSLDHNTDNAERSVQIVRRRLPESFTGTTALGFCGQKLLLAGPEEITVLNSRTAEQVGEMNLPSKKQKKKRVANDDALQANLRIVSSRDGKYAALLCPLELHLLDVQALAYIGKIPHKEGKGPYTAAAFTAGSDAIAVGTGDNSLRLYNVPSKKPVELAAGFLDSLATRLHKMPGSISGLSFLPNPKRRAGFIRTPSSTCFVDFDSAMHPWTNPKRRRGRSKQRADSVGTNGRVIKLVNVCLAFEFTTADSAVLVEKDWASVALTFPPPVYRHRYGS